MSRVMFVIGTVALLLLPQATRAQAAPPSTSPTDLQKLLKPGEVLVVIDDKGERTTGALSDLSSSTLTLQVSRERRGWLIPDGAVAPEQRQFALGSVTRIDRRDSLKEGTLLGLAAGFGLALYTGRLCDSEDFCNATAILSFSALIGGPVIGTLVDHAITTPIYRAPTGRWTASLALSPGLRRQGGGISVRLAF